MSLPNEDEEEDIHVICCAGRPLCELDGDAAVAAQIAGCLLYKRIVIGADGSETVVERVLN